MRAAFAVRASSGGLWNFGRCIALLCGKAHLTAVQAAQDILTDLNVPSGDCAICLVDFNMDEADTAVLFASHQERLSSAG